MLEVFEIRLALLLFAIWLRIHYCFYVLSLCAIDLIAMLICQRTKSELRFICHNSAFRTHIFYVNYFGHSTTIFDSQINMTCVLIICCVLLLALDLYDILRQTAPLCIATFDRRSFIYTILVISLVATVVLVTKLETTQKRKRGIGKRTTKRMPRTYL